MYWLARTAIKKDHRQDGSNNRNLFLQRVWKMEVWIRVLAGLVSFETFLLGLWKAIFSLALTCSAFYAYLCSYLLF